MPVWNRVNIVERAIDSVLSQTFKDYELIIINGSKDDRERSIPLGETKNLNIRLRKEGL